MKPWKSIAVLTVCAGLQASPAAAANLLRGQQLYQMHCAACHGIRGEGIISEAPKFQRGERLDKPDMLLMQSVRSGKNIMPPFFGLLKDQDILEVLLYIRTLR